ncbi:hypothetical protein HHI36_021909 [Cryptolaemus montrouzieri]|uniref:Uncharacterized protein n=1 Tax=Cryptolaemus montrouzieri TaxID=559131 RepID=A0ABD2MZK0_9CUCU
MILITNLRCFRSGDKLRDLQQQTPNDLYEELKIIIDAAAREVLGEKPMKEKQPPPWWNDDLEKAVMKKKGAWSKWLSTKTMEERNIYKNARSRVQEDIRTSKNLFLEKTTEQINTCAGNTRANKAWRTLESMRIQNKNRSGLNLISMKEWTDHFENLLTEDREKFMSSNDRTQEDINKHMTLVEQPEISTEDVRVALSSEKNGKKPEIRNIHVELLKAAPWGILDVLTQLFNECLRGKGL